MELEYHISNAIVIYIIYLYFVFINIFIELDDDDSLFYGIWDHVVFSFFKSRLSFNGSNTSLNSWSKLTQTILLKFPTKSCSKPLFIQAIQSTWVMSHIRYVYIYIHKYVYYTPLENQRLQPKKITHSKERNIIWTKPPFFFGGGGGTGIHSLHPLKLTANAPENMQNPIFQPLKCSGANSLASFARGRPTAWKLQFM